MKINRNHRAVLAVAVWLLLSLGGFALAEEHRGAMPGVLSGALVGGSIGDYAIDQKRSADVTAGDYHYRPETGTLVKIESVSIEPYTVQSGGRVELRATYAVLAEDFTHSLPVTLTYEIRYDQELVGKLTVEVGHSSGTYSSTVPLALPDKAPAGTYRVLTSLRAGEVVDSRETTLVVI